MIVDLLDKTDISVFLYYGEKDWICNWRKGEDLAKNTAWNHQNDFNDAAFETMYDNYGKAIGQIR